MNKRGRKPPFLLSTSFVRQNICNVLQIILARKTILMARKSFVRQKKKLKIFIAIVFSRVKLIAL